MKPRKPGILLKKACRCRGPSEGTFPAPYGPVPIAVGLMFGLTPRMRCVKCKKPWRRVKPAKKPRRER